MSWTSSASVPGAGGGEMLRALAFAQGVPAVAHYFFNLDGSDIPDVGGIDLPDMQAVRAQATLTAGQMLMEAEGTFSGEEWRVEVANQAGQPVLTLRISATEYAI